MRPVSTLVHRPDVSLDFIEGLLRNQIGRYCSICEIPLHDIARAWHAERMRAVPSKANAADLSELLLLCPDCHRAAEAAPTRGAGALLLPHRGPAFRVGGESPLTYELETVIEQRWAADGGRLLQSVQTERVIVKASTPEAQATIDHFALNGDFDRSSYTVRVQAPTFPNLDDSRIAMRTRAWHTAASAAGGLRDEDPLMRRTIQGQLTRMIGAYGFWSVWATVLWDQFRDRRLLRAMLLPPRLPAPPAGVAAAAHAAHAGNAAAFPGTRSDALFYESESGR